MRKGNDINEILGKISFEVLSEITQCIIDADCSKSVPLISIIPIVVSKENSLSSKLIISFQFTKSLRSLFDSQTPLCCG